MTGNDPANGGESVGDHDLRSYGAAARAQAEPTAGGAARRRAARVVLNLSDPPPARWEAIRASRRGSVAGDRLRRRRAPSLAGAAASRHRHDRLRAVPGRRRQGAARHRGSRSSPMSGCTPTMPAPLLRWLPEAASARASSCFPTPGPRSATTSAGWCRRPRCANWPASWRRRRAAHCHGYRRVRALDAAGRARSSGSFGWTAQGRATGASGRPIGRSTRYEQKALREGRRCAYFRFRRR